MLVQGLLVSLTDALVEYTYDCEAPKATEHSPHQYMPEVLKLQSCLLSCFFARCEDPAPWLYFWQKAMPGLPSHFALRVEWTLNESGAGCTPDLAPYIIMLGKASSITYLRHVCEAFCAFPYATSLTAYTGVVPD